jgi:FkbM family methyltransferase
VSKVKEALKGLIVRTLSPRMQQRIRAYYLARRVVTSNTFHEREMHVLASLVAPGDFVADIGANVGAYTKELSRLVGAEGVVYAFEPVAANHSILETVIRKGRLGNVQTFRIALGAKHEERKIAIPELGGFTGYYWARFAREGEPGEKVTVSTLDEMVKSGVLKRLDFLKCDVEGAEIEVLSGASTLLESARPAWLIEVARDTSAAVFALLARHGYRAFVYADTLIPTDGYRDGEYSNYFFVHPGSGVWQRLPRAQEN